MKIVGVCGSPNPSGKTITALNIALEQSKKEGAEIQLIILREYIDAPYNATPEQLLSDKIITLLNIIRSADGIILATPVHWFNISSLMKTFIDHLTALEAPLFPMIGTPAACIAVCEEDGGTQACMAMAATLLHLGFTIVPNGALYYNTSMSGGELNWQNTDLPLIGANVYRMAYILKEYRKMWGYDNMAK